MLVALTCNCASAEPLIRQFLAGQHINAFSVPLLKGEEAKGWVNKHNLSALQKHLSIHNSFAIIVGWETPKEIFYADINLPNPEERIKAEVIVEKFA